MRDHQRRPTIQPLGRGQPESVTSGTEQPWGNAAMAEDSGMSTASTPGSSSSGAAPPPEAGAGQWHTVAAGDTLSGIALDVYGDLRKWPLIYESNLETVADPDLIEVGWKLFIPPLDTKQSLSEGTIDGMDRVAGIGEHAELNFGARIELSPDDWAVLADEQFALREGRSASAAATFGATMSIWLGVLRTVGDERFDRACGAAGEDNQDLVIGKSVNQGILLDLISFPAPRSLGDLVPGDAVYFLNTPKMRRKHPGSMGYGENTIYRGEGKFTGLGVNTMTEKELLGELKRKYDMAPAARERNHADFDPALGDDVVALADIPGIQFGTVMRLDQSAVDLL